MVHSKEDQEILDWVSDEMQKHSIQKEQISYYLSYAEKDGLLSYMEILLLPKLSYFRKILLLENLVKLFKFKGFLYYEISNFLENLNKEDFKIAEDYLP